MPKMYSTGITMTVPESKVAERLAQGWVLAEDKPEADAPEKKPRAKAKAAEDKPEADAPEGDA